jgi:hypothetical protein
MEACNAYYYAARDPLSAAGDFTTAPEIHQMFGELVSAAGRCLDPSRPACRRHLCRTWTGQGNTRQRRLAGHAARGLWAKSSG